MSWEDALQDASFRGVRIDVINTRDSASRDIATYEYPFVDGGDIDDLGRKPRNLRITALFWGDDYDMRLQSFITALDKRGSGEFIHPVFGSMPYMQCIEYSATHEAENVDYCVVEAVFLQAKPGVPFFDTHFPLAQADIIFNQVQTALEQAQTAIDNLLAPLRRAKKMMRRVRALATTSLNMVTVLKGDLTDFISTTTDFIHFPKAYMNDLQGALTRTSLQAKSDISQHPGHYLRQPETTRNPGRIVPESSDVAGVASIVMADWKNGRARLEEISTLPARLVTGQTPSPVAGAVRATPEDITELVTAVKIQAALQLALDASDILSDENIIDLLSPDDVEQIAGDTRTAIQAAIDQTRLTFADATRAVSEGSTASGVTWQPVVSGLKDIALSVQEQASTVIARRPPLTTRTVNAASSLHLVAHLWYGDYTRAAELLRLNPGLRNPNKLNAGDILNAYAR